MRGRVESSIKCAIGSVALSELCIVADVLLYWMGYLILLYEKIVIDILEQLLMSSHDC